MEEVLRLVQENRELRARVEILEKDLKEGVFLLERAVNRMQQQQEVINRQLQFQRAFEEILNPSQKDDKK